LLVICVSGFEVLIFSVFFSWLELFDTVVFLFVSVDGFKTSLELFSVSTTFVLDVLSTELLVSNKLPTVSNKSKRAATPATRYQKGIIFFLSFFGWFSMVFISFLGLFYISTYYVLYV